ncbi:MAG: SOS response-associated peptidase [Gammaproteobacteria bacterium]|nr:SOS response-associated peptidase [Gammaproteobacteria bacterium]
MCGRFYLDIQQDELKSHFNLATSPDLIPRYNIAPSQAIAAVMISKQERQVKMFRWGLIPFWSKDEKIGYRTINARAETVDKKPAFRAAFKYRRCLIPASGFFEWKAENGGKQPYCIHPKKSPLIAFAGLYEHWESEAGRLIASCTIIVTEANRSVMSIHDRMPVILNPVDYDVWLDPDIQDPEIIKPLLRPCPDTDIETYRVGKQVNNPRNDDPDCIIPLA